MSPETIRDSLHTLLDRSGERCSQRFGFGTEYVGTYESGLGNGYDPANAEMLGIAARLYFSQRPRKSVYIWCGEDFAK